MHGALQEALHVFVRGARVRVPARILEVGFGTGLNFMATILSLPSSEIHYVALDHTLPPAEVLRRLNHATQLGLPQLGHTLLAWRRTLPNEVKPGTYRFAYGPAKLQLELGNATRAVLPPGYFNAVYLDAFSPRVNPELWTASFLTLCYRATAPGGHIATYSAAGHVRRAMCSAGFQVAREPGPVGKRAMTVGIKACAPAA